jgi:hypothetical protein
MSLIEPYLPKLLALWISVLRDYAILSTQPPPIQKAYRGAFYAFSSVTFVMDYYKKAWPPILLAASQLVETDIWLTEAVIPDRQVVKDPSIPDGVADEVEEEDDYDYPAPSDDVVEKRKDDFMVMFGLCMACMAGSEQEDAIGTAITGLSFMLGPRYLKPSVIDVIMLKEMFNALGMHMQIGDRSTMIAIANLFHKVVPQLSKEYFDSAGQNDSAEAGNDPLFVFHEMVEVALAPLQRFTIAPAGLVVPRDTEPLLEKSLQTVAAMIDICSESAILLYLPTLLLLVIRTMEKTTSAVVRTEGLRTITKLATVGTRLQGAALDEVNTVLLSAIVTTVESLEQQVQSPEGTPSANMLLAMVALLTPLIQPALSAVSPSAVTPPLIIPVSLHVRCKAMLARAIESKNIEVRVITQFSSLTYLFAYLSVLILCRSKRLDCRCFCLSCRFPLPLQEVPHRLLLLS